MGVGNIQTLKKLSCPNWKRISRILTTTVVVAISILIAGIIFFKFVPGFGFYIVKTGSMEPAIKPGDIIFTTPPGEAIHPGQVITFQTGKDVLVTHRVLSVENGKIQTRGDANEDPDRARISFSQVEGIYFFKIPGIGLITNIMHTKIGWFCIVLVPSFLLVLWIAVEIFKEVLKKPKNKGSTPAVTSMPVSQKSLKAEYKPALESRGMPSRSAVEYIKKELKDALKDVYYSK